MNPIKRLAIALMAVLMIGLMLFMFVSLLLAKIAMAVLLVVAILVALMGGGRKPKKIHRASRCRRSRSSVSTCRENGANWGSK